MTGYPSVIQAVDEFIHQLRRFLAVAVIDRFGERIFHNIIIAAYNTVVPGDFLIKGDIAVIPWPAPRILERFHTFIVSGAQIFQPRKYLANAGNQ